MEEREKKKKKKRERRRTTTVERNRWEVEDRSGRGPRSDQGGCGKKGRSYKYWVWTRSGATYAVSDNDGVCSGCLLSEQISE